MDIHTSYTFDVLISIIGLHFSAYIIYGRLKGRPLVGNYKSGAQGYDVFRRIVNNNKYLAITAIITLVFIANAVFEGLKIFDQSSSYASLIAIPIVIVILLLVSLKVISSTLGKSR